MSVSRFQPPTRLAVARRFAVIGGGPSGIYTAERLAKSDPQCLVDILERLPVPFGLLRYGVAPDHQGTKGTSRVMERVLAMPNVRFLGNVHIGRTIGLDEVRKAYDAVVLAVGADVDRKLDVPGEHLGNIYGSGVFTRWLNDHPDAARISLAGVRRMAVVGLGNVAIDVARVALKATGAFQGSDLGPDPSQELASADLDQVTIIGRGGVESARFTKSELTELVTLGDVGVKVAPASALAAVSTTSATLSLGAPAGRKTLTFRFNATPIAFTGQDFVQGVVVKGPDGVIDTIPADIVVTCVGFSTSPFCGLAQENGRFVHDVHQIEAGLYVTGWAATGPQGTIPGSRTLSHAVADRVLGETSPHGVRGVTPKGSTGYTQWQHIDKVERKLAAAGRVRMKFRTVDEMLASLQDVASA